MSRHLTAAVVALGLSIALGTVTSAADLGSPAPAPIYTKAPVLAPWSWTGFYVGGNVGYGWGRADNTDSFVSPCPICLVNPPDFATLLATGSNNIGGVIGGGQFGYNWQATNFLLGIEADIQASGQKGTSALNNAFVLPIAFFLPNPLTSSATSLTNSTSLEWFGTVRGRAGYVSDRWMIYGTGGLAYGELDVSSTASPVTISVANPNVPFNISGSATKIGWVAGAGIENAFSANWSWKLEYLYMDLGTVTATGTVPAQGCLGNALACNGTSAGTATYTTKFTDNIVRLGINYKLN